MSSEAWAFCGVLVTQVVTYLLGRRETQRIDNTGQVDQLVADLAAVKGDVREVKTDLHNVKGWVGSIDRRMAGRRRRWL